MYFTTHSLLKLAKFSISGAKNRSTILDKVRDPVKETEVASWKMKF